MIVVDIGNTNVVIGLYVKKKLIKVFRMDTKKKNMKNELKNIFSLKKISKMNLDFRVCAIASVSSYYQTKEIVNFFKNLGLTTFNITLKNISNNIKFNYIPGQLGADRIANTFSAIHKYGKDTLVIDFGTATTFDITIKGNYAGGIIAPGIKISHLALVDQASKLKKTLIIKTKKIIANDTKKSMQSGFYWGYLSLINGLIKKIISERKIKPKIILTGGLAKIFKSEIEFNTYHEPNLTLEGLYIIGKKKYA